MANYVVTFRISSDRANYDDVYNSLRDVAQAEATSLPWEETSSFMAFESPKTTANLMNSLYFDSKLLEAKDALLLINLSQSEYSVKGENYPNTLKSSLGLKEV